VSPEHDPQISSSRGLITTRSQERGSIVEYKHEKTRAIAEGGADGPPPTEQQVGKGKGRLAREGGTSTPQNTLIAEVASAPGGASVLESSSAPGGASAPGKLSARMLMPGDIVTPQSTTTGQTTGKQGEMTSPRIAVLSAAKKKIKRGCDPAKGATYTFMEDGHAMSSISTHSAINNGGISRKRKADDDDSLKLKRPRFDYNRAYEEAHCRPRRGRDTDEEYGRGLREFSGSKDPRVIRRIRAVQEEDLADDLFRFIQRTPLSWTTNRVVQAASTEFPDVDRVLMGATISTILLAMRKTALHILFTSIESGRRDVGSKGVVIPLNMGVITQFISS